MNFLSDLYTPADQVETLCHNQSRIASAVQTFAEVEQQDPRISIVMAASRIDAGLMQSLELYRLPKNRIPAKFQSRTKIAFDQGLIDEDFRKFTSAIRLLRNGIVHGDTRSNSLSLNPMLQQVRKIHERASVVPVWASGPASPDDDLAKSIWSSCLVGVVAAELDTFDDRGGLTPKGFGVVRQFLNRMAGS